MTWQKREKILSGCEGSGSLRESSKGYLGYNIPARFSSHPNSRMLTGREPPRFPARRRHTFRPGNPPALSSSSPLLPSPPLPARVPAALDSQCSSVIVVSRPETRVSLPVSRTTLPREPRGRGRLCHLTRTLARQWRRPYYAGAVLEGVGLLPALTAVLATEEGFQRGPGSAGKGDRDQSFSNFSAWPRS